MKYNLQVQGQPSGIVVESATELSPEQSQRLVSMFGRLGTEKTMSMAQNGVVNVDRIMNPQPLSPVAEPAEIPEYSPTGTPALDKLGGILKYPAAFGAGTAAAIPGADIMTAATQAPLKEAGTLARYAQAAIKDPSILLQPSGELPQEIQPMGLKGLVDLYQQAGKQREQAEGLSPVMATLGRIAPAMVGWEAMMSKMPAALQATKSGKLANILKAGARGGTAGAGIGQAERGFKVDPTSTAIDVGIGAALPMLAEAGKGPASKLWKSVFKRPAKVLKAERAAGQTLEEELVEKGVVSPTLKGLETKAGKAVDVIETQLDDVLKNVKGKVKPDFVYKQVAKVKSQFLDPKGNIIPGEENTVKIIDKTLSQFKTGLKKGWYTAKEANEAKRKYWRIVKGVFEKEAPPIKKDVQHAIGTGLRKGVEEQAGQTFPKGAKTIADLNKQMSMWLRTGGAAGEASERISKGTIGKVMPLLLGAGGAGAAAASGPLAAAPLAIAALMSSPAGRMAVAQAIPHIGKIAPVAIGLKGGIEGEK